MHEALIEVYTPYTDSSCPLSHHETFPSARDMSGITFSSSLLCIPLLCCCPQSNAPATMPDPYPPRCAIQSVLKNGFANVPFPEDTTSKAMRTARIPSVGNFSVHSCGTPQILTVLLQWCVSDEVERKRARRNRTYSLLMTHHAATIAHMAPLAPRLPVKKTDFMT